MGWFREDHDLGCRYHESLDEKRDFRSVSPFTSILNVQANNFFYLVLLFMGLQGTTQT